MTRTRIHSAVALLGLLAIGCVERTTELTAAEREQVAEFVSSDAPSPQNELDISFENKIQLVGYDLDVETITPGEAFTLTWYWKCERPLEEGWLLFTHIADASGSNRLNSDGESTIRRLYQPGRWKSGEYVRDVQRITLPEDWASNRATFFVGVWNGPHRLQIVRGPNDGENRARAASLAVAASPDAPDEAPTPALPTVRAGRLGEGATIDIDGELDEAAWQSAAPTAAFVNTLNGAAAQPDAKARVLWDDEKLYVAFEVVDDFLKSTFEDADDHLWEQDCVEIMIDPDGDGRNYFEMQVSPTGVVFDTRYDSARQPQPFGDLDWTSGLTARVHTNGTPNDDEADEGYTVEIAIPWSAFAAGEPATQKPAANQMWRINFFVMDAQREGQRSVGWSPPRVGDFHTLERFGRVLFHDPSAAAAPAGGPAQPRPQLQLPPNLINRLRDQAQAGGAMGTAVGQPGPARPNPGEEVPMAPTMAAMAVTAMVAAPTMAAETE